MSEELERPSRYTGRNGKDLLDLFGEYFPDDYNRGFYVECIIKYIARYPQKGGIEDLKKAIVYIRRLIEYEERLEMGTTQTLTKDRTEGFECNE